MFKIINDEFDWAAKNNKMLYLYLAVAIASLIAAPIAFLLEALGYTKPLPSGMMCSEMLVLIFIALVFCYIHYKGKQIREERLKRLDEENRQLRAKVR